MSKRILVVFLVLALSVVMFSGFTFAEQGIDGTTLIQSPNPCLYRNCHVPWPSCHFYELCDPWRIPYVY